MRAQLRIGSGLSWVVAWMLAIGAIVVTLLWGPAIWTWWVGLALLVPLVALTAWRQDQKGSTDEVAVTGDCGPWGPPAM